MLSRQFAVQAWSSFKRQFIVRKDIREWWGCIRKKRNEMRSFSDSNEGTKRLTVSNIANQMRWVRSEGKSINLVNWTCGPHFWQHRKSDYKGLSTSELWRTRTEYSPLSRSFWVKGSKEVTRTRSSHCFHHHEPFLFSSPLTSTTTLEARFWKLLLLKWCLMIMEFIIFLNLR